MPLLDALGIKLDDVLEIYASCQLMELDSCKNIMDLYIAGHLPCLYPIEGYEDAAHKALVGDHAPLPIKAF